MTACKNHVYKDKKLTHVNLAHNHTSPRFNKKCSQRPESDNLKSLVDLIYLQMLKIFFSANAFSLLAFFPDVPIGEKPHNRCQLCKIVKCFEFLFLLLILKHSLRIRPEVSMALHRQRFSPLTDLLYFIILHKWIITHDRFVTLDFKHYDW